MLQGRTLTTRIEKIKSLNSHSLAYPDPFDLVIEHSMLTIEFYAYQGTVDFDDMSDCLGAANRDTNQKIAAGLQDTPMGPGPYIRTSGAVTFSLEPDEQLTWARFSLVPRSIWAFVMKNDFKGTQFIVLWRGLGPIGYGQLTTATSEAQSAATMYAFPDPYDKHIEQIGLTMEFYGYRGSISAVAMRDCIATASTDVVRHLLDAEALMSREATSYTYSAGGVYLFLSPREHLTWHMWAFVPIWIQEFVTENGFKETQFVLLWEGFGVVGFGQLTGQLNDTIS